MSFAQPLPWPMLAAALLVVAALAWRAGWWAGRHAGSPPSVWRRATLVSLRAATLLLFVTLLMQPVRLLPDPTARGTFVVLLDASRSMALRDAGGAERLASAVEAIRNSVAPALDGRFALQIVTFGDQARQVSLDDLHNLSAGDATTDVARALDFVSRRASSEPLAGALLVSDGGFVLPADAAVESFPVPLNVLGVGDAHVVRDQEVRQVTVGDSSTVGATIDVTATVASTGFAGQPVEVRLLANGSPLDVRRVTATDGVPTELVFRVAPDATVATRYTVEVAKQEGELTTDNNSRTVLVPPPGRARRVLVLEGAPGFEHSFLKRALDRDPALEVDAVIRKGSNDAGSETFYVQASSKRANGLSTGFPGTRRELFAYDAVVLANIDVDALTTEQLQQLSDFVGERGGGLLVLGARTLEAEGLSGTMLEELLPVAVSDRQAPDTLRAGFKGEGAKGITLTNEGQRHPVMRLGATTAETKAKWAALPTLPAIASVGGARPGATVLAWTPEPAGLSRPLVVVQRYGRGRVLAFSGEAAWRWRMMLPSSDQTYSTFWRQATRWLAQSAPEPVSVQNRVLAPHEVEVTVEARNAEFEAVRDADVRLTIDGIDEGPVQVAASPVPGTNGVYRASVRVPEGVSRVAVEARARAADLGRVDAWVLSGPNQDELTSPARDDAQLTRLATRFGGQLVRDDALADVVRSSRAGSGPGAMIQQDVWHTPWLLGTLILLLTGEWALRRKWGLR
ncbi:MAG: glutamine amidotransferase [Vicinamibacterales bacterium]